MALLRASPLLNIRKSSPSNGLTLGNRPLTASRWGQSAQTSPALIPAIMQIVGKRPVPCGRPATIYRKRVSGDDGGVGRVRKRDAGGALSGSAARLPETPRRLAQTQFARPSRKRNPAWLDHRPRLRRRARIGVEFNPYRNLAPIVNGYLTSGYNTRATTTAFSRAADDQQL